MDFDHRRAQFGGHLDLGRRCTDEQRNADAGMLELANDGRKLAALAHRVEPAFGGALACAFPARGRRRAAASSARCRPFRSVAAISKLSGLSISRLQARDVVVANVAAILAQMRGDAVAAGGDRELGGAHRIGMAPAARVADGGDVIDVDAEAETFHA